jgi:coenzyme F420-reducing hydrogenase delta subunit
VKIYLFYCSTNIDSDELTGACSKYGNDFHFIPLPCSGKIDIRYLTKAFETGADGIAVVTCKKGDCRYLEGNLRAQKRVEAIENLIEEIGVEKGRSVLFEIGDNGIEGVIQALSDFRLKIGTLPSLMPIAGNTFSKR